MRIIYTTIILTFITASQGQNIDFGFRYMPTIASLEMKTFSGNSVPGEPDLGYATGPSIEFKFTNHLGIRTAALFYSVCQHYTDLQIEQKIKLNYLNIPILFSLNSNSKRRFNLNINAGPETMILTDCQLRTFGDDRPDAPQAILSLQKSNIGFAYGAGCDFGLKDAPNVRIGLGYRGLNGMTEVADNGKSLDNNSFYVLDHTRISTYSGYAGLSIVF